MHGVRCSLRNLDFNAAPAHSPVQCLLATCCCPGSQLTRRRWWVATVGACAVPHLAQVLVLPSGAAPAARSQGSAGLGAQNGLLANIVWRSPPLPSLIQVLRGVTTAKEVLYWTLIVGFPCAGWLVLFPSLIYLKFSGCAQRRARTALARVPARELSPCLSARQSVRSMLSRLPLPARPWFASIKLCFDACALRPYAGPPGRAAERWPNPGQRCFLLLRSSAHRARQCTVCAGPPSCAAKP